MACLKMQPDGFRMFAESEAIGSEIHTVTGGLMVAHVANLNRIRQAAGGLDPEIGENGMARVRVGDDKGLFSVALAAFVDLVGVGRAPIVGRPQLELRV